MDGTEFRELLVMMRNDPAFRRMVREVLLEPETPKGKVRELQPPQVDRVPDGYMLRETARELLGISAGALRNLLHDNYLVSYGERKLLKVDEFCAYALKRRNVEVRQRVLDWMQEHGHGPKEARRVERSERAEDQTQLALAV